jgi:predicted NAD/FAD-binding protein
MHRTSHVNGWGSEMRVAVIGTGIAGNAAAWTLSKNYPVTVYDREIRPGGHSHTVTIDYDGTQLAVDIGFIVYNELNYPELTALFAHLDIETVESCMSFAVTADGGRFEWKGGGSSWRETAQGLFAQPRNLLSPSYLWMLRDNLTFNAQSVEDQAAGRLAGVSLREYFRDRKFATRLLTDYLVPMGAAIWSAPASEMLDFPAENFVAFFSNHRLLQYDRPVWRTVRGGSQRYVEKLTSAFRDQLRLGCAVTSIERTPHGVVVNDSHGRRDIYDHVVIASHSDQALAMLSDADDRERAVLGAIGYAPNTVYLHRDVRLMPKRRRAWASWNFLRWQRKEPPSMMSR